MALGSNCWQSGDSERCADSTDPSIWPHVPILHLQVGTTVRFHLGFDAQTVELTVGGASMHTEGSRDITWRASRRGLAELFFTAGAGSGTYVVRFT